MPYRGAKFRNIKYENKKFYLLVHISIRKTMEQKILLRVATSLAISFLFLNIFITSIKAETTVELQTNFGKFIGVQQEKTATFLGLPYAKYPFNIYII